MKKVYEKEEGIASTVGTIFALMIFTALLGMFMTQVVPVTMKGNEAEHDRQVLSQLSNLRSIMDILTLTKDTNYTAYAPIKLGADGIPFFASPTYGQLSLYPSTPPVSKFMMSFKFTDKFGNVIYRNSSGSLQFISPNKYYAAEVFEYANGGILRYNYQSKTAVYAIYPNIKFQNIPLGYALSFPGSSSAYVSIPHDDSLDITGPITLEAWVYIKSEVRQTFISHSQQYVLWMKDNGGIRFADTHGHYVDTDPLPSKYLNTWIHIAAVFSGHAGDTVSSSNAQIYINGQPMGAHWGGTWSPQPTTSTVTFGNKFNGYMDEVRILNRALSPDEILSDYYAGHHYPSRSGATGWYHFDEGNAANGAVVVDSSDYHNNGTIHGSVTSILITGVNIDTTLQNIYGSPDSITGTETRAIGVSLQGVSSESYNIGGTLNITVRDFYRFTSSFAFNFTGYWIQYLTNALNNSGLQEGVDYVVTGDTISIFSVEDANINMVYFVLSIER